MFDLTMGCILRKKKRLIIHKRVSFHSIIYILLLLLLCSCMMTIRQDIFNICITCVVYEVRRKGIIYSKTYFFSLFTHCLGIKKSQSNKSRKNMFSFLPKCPIVFKEFKVIVFLLCVIFCLLFWTGFSVLSGNKKSYFFYQLQQQKRLKLDYCVCWAAGFATADVSNSHPNFTLCLFSHSLHMLYFLLLAFHLHCSSRMKSLCSLCQWCGAMYA